MDKEDKDTKGRSLKILVVEDQPDLLRAVVVKLQSYGLSPIVATDGEEAVAKLSEKPDIVWLDIFLPKMNGYDFLKIVRERKETEKLPVVVVTNSAGHQMRQELEKLGILDFFVKADTKLEDVIGRIQNQFSKN